MLVMMEMRGKLCMPSGVSVGVGKVPLENPVVGLVR